MVLVSKRARRRFAGGPAVLDSPMPALLTSTSSRWWRVPISSAPLLTDSSAVTSSWIASTVPLRLGRVESAWAAC